MEKNLLKLNIQMFASNDDLTSVFKSVNDVLKHTKVNDVTADSSEQYGSLPDGYYYVELKEAELMISKNTQQPMVKWVFKNVEEGITINENDELQRLRNTNNKNQYVYHSLKDSTAAERFISDALKFEGDKPGQPFLEKEYFTTAETLYDALQLLVGQRLWLHVDTTENKDGSTSTWTRFVSWKRATKLGLEK
jgi:hypothetical protein